MIEGYLKDYVENRINGMTCSKNYSALNDDYVVVYDDGGQPINKNDELRVIYRFYQIEVGSSDWDKAKAITQKIYELFYGLENKEVTIDFNDGVELKKEKYFLQSLFPQSPPIRVGVINDIMIYTINLEAMIYKLC